MARIAGNLRGLLSGEMARQLRLGRLADEWVVPRHIPRSEPPYRPSLVLGEAGLDLRTENQLETVRSWRTERFRTVWKLLRDDPHINTQRTGKPHLHNGYYPTPDAEIYAAMILEQQPARIIEIGSGFSTLIARKTVESEGLHCPIDVVDPSPRTDVSQVADRVLLQFVEDVSIADLELGENTLVFVDSSHICRGRGDIPHLFCKIIPALPAGTRIHVHDIFIPYDYPAEYLERLYTEQYVLHATLAHNPRYRVLMATHYLVRTHPEEMQETFGDVVGREDEYFGASFWFEVV